MGLSDKNQFRIAIFLMFGVSIAITELYVYKWGIIQHCWLTKTLLPVAAICAFLIFYLSSGLFQKKYGHKPWKKIFS